MSDEPLYCVVCGMEECDHPLDAEGPFCHTCGVVPAPGRECKFYKPDGRNEMCVGELESEPWMSAPLTEDEIVAIEAAENEEGEPW